MMSQTSDCEVKGEHYLSSSKGSLRVSKLQNTGPIQRSSLPSKRLTHGADVHKDSTTYSSPISNDQNQMRTEFGEEDRKESA